MINAIHPKAHRTAAMYRTQRGGLTTKPQMICDDKGRRRRLHLSEGQANVQRTAAAVIEGLPATKSLLADQARPAFRSSPVSGP